MKKLWQGQKEQQNNNNNKKKEWKTEFRTGEKPDKM